MLEIDQMRANDSIDREERLIATRLFKIRTKLGIEREELATASGFSLSDILAYENAIEPIPASAIFVLSSTMGVSIDCFYEDDIDIIQTSHCMQSDEEKTVLLS